MKIKCLIAVSLLAVMDFTFQPFCVAETMEPNAEFVRLRQDAEKGLADAQEKLGLLYLKESHLSSKTMEEMKKYGKPVELDYKEALKWFHKAAGQGYARAQYDIGAAYYFGEGVDRNYLEAYKWYRKAADQGYAAAQRSVGLLYIEGNGVVQDYTQALQWFQKAADQGNEVAQYDVGIMYYNGEGVNKDYAEAFKWYRKAADQGYAAAQCIVGLLYKEGNGVTQDYTQALQWLQKAADQGNNLAQNNVGIIYYNGEGVNKDYAEAFKWYRKAADQGDQYAQFNLGIMYARGHGVPQDYSMAMKWYRKSANRGCAQAQYVIGTLYANGQGVNQDNNEAMKWYRRAAKQGWKEAQETLRQAGASLETGPNPKGLYALQSFIDFNVLDSFTIDPSTGQITLIGHRDARYTGPSIPYLDHLAELLENPSPEFSLNWTPESKSRINTLFNNFNSKEYVRGLAKQWGEVFDANGHPTSQGRWLLPLIEIKPTSSGDRLGTLGIEVREITQRLRNVYERLEIVSVESGSVAERAGLVPGDIITNSANAAAFVHRIRTLGEGAEDMLMIRRKGQDDSSIIMMNITLGGTTGDPWAEIDKFDIAQKMLAKYGNDQGAMLIHCLAEVQRINLGESKAGGSAASSLLIAVAGYNDAHWQNMAEYEAGRMSEDTILEHAFRAIFSAMENAFAFDDRPLTATFDYARQRGADSSSAFDQTLLVFNQRIGPYLEQAMKTLLVNNREIQIPPEVMANSIGGPQVEVVPEYRGVDPHSTLARVLYSADYLGKSLINRPSLEQKIPSYQTDFAFERNNPDKVGPWHATADYHLWFSIESLDFIQSKDGNTLQTRGAKMRFNIREKSPSGKDIPDIPGGYEELLTSLYDDFAKEFPELHELREAAKLAGVARWLKSKRPDLKLPRTGRDSWSGTDKAPGFIYLTWSPQERPGRLAMALSAMGGASLSLIKVPKEIVGVAEDNSIPVVDLSHHPLTSLPESEDPALISKILHTPADVPIPQPVGWVTRDTKDGQNVTAVSFIPPKEGDIAAVQVQQDAGDKALILWKANDLEGAMQALTDELQKTTDPRAKANLMLMQAQILHESGDDAEAIKRLNEASSLDPKNPMIEIMLAKEKFDSGDLNGSIESLKKYVALDPKNQAAAKLLADLRKDLEGESSATPQDNSTPGQMVGGLASFTSPLKEAVTTLNQPLETLKADSDLKDFHIEPYKLHGLAPPQGLAETKEWKQLEAQRAHLQQSYSAIESQIKEVRAQRSRGEGDPRDLEKLESQFQKQQLDIKKKQDAVDKKMTNDIVQWNEKEGKKP